MLNIEHLRMFVETVDTGSFSACARKLGKVQSAVSQGIANLEVELGTELFDRTTRKPTLTREGEQLLAHAKAVIQQALELNSAAEALSRQEEAGLSLAIDNALLMPSLTKILTAFGDKFPATAIEIITVAGTDVTHRIKNGSADIGLMFSGGSLRNDVDVCYIGSLPFYAVCHAAHPLSQLKRVRAADLLPHRQIVQRGESGEVSEQIALMSANTWWANSIDTIMYLVTQGVGWSYLPAHYVLSNLDQKALTILPVVFDHKAWNTPVDLVTPKNKGKGPAMTWLHKELKNLLDDDTNLNKRAICSSELHESAGAIR